MVAPNREIANKFFPFNISAMSNSVEVYNLSEDINMDETRGRSIALSPISSRATSTHSSTLSIPYVDRMKVQNNNFFWFNQTEQENFQLSYTSLKEGNSDDQNRNQVSVAANPTKNTREQYVSIKDLVLNFSCSSNKNMFNMQLPYDIDQALDFKSWDSNFHAISLHGSMLHLVLDIKYIKESLRRIQKYILDKSIEGDKANNVKDLEGVSEVAWGFISALYESHWDQLIADKNNLSFRCKIKAQFSLQIIKETSPKKGKDIDKPGAISVFPLPIPAKSPKEVVKISKFFKKNLDNKGKKSYAQALSANTNTARETLKIKEVFPNLQNKKIENIQKIISNGSKTKPQLKMTTKRPS